VVGGKEEEQRSPWADNSEVLTLDLICRILYIQTENSKITQSWEKAIRNAATSNGPQFHEMQLTLDDVPVIVDKCIDFLYAHGM
jgi:Arf-GAP/Rho-GAP domain/ANK repeat/PH domain-containing protein 1